MAYAVAPELTTSPRPLAPCPHCGGPRALVPDHKRDSVFVTCLDAQDAPYAPESWYRYECGALTPAGALYMSCCETEQDMAEASAALRQAELRLGLLRTRYGRNLERLARAERERQP